MKSAFPSAVLTALLFVLPACGQEAPREDSRQESGSSDEYLKPMQPVIGQWKMTGGWEGGPEFKGEEYSVWMLGKKFIRSVGWFSNYEGARIDYQIVTGWDPGERRIVQSFSYSDGGHSRRVGEYDPVKRVLKSKEQGVSGGGESYSFDVELQFTDDTILWKGTNHQGPKNLPPLTFTFERVAAAKTDAIPQEALAALEFFVGSWEGETSLNGKQLGKDVDNRTWLEGGHAVLMESLGTEDGKQVHASGISGWDAQGRQLVERWYTSEGLSVVVRYPLARMHKDAWTGNFTVTFPDARRFRGNCVLKPTAAGFEWTAKWMEDGKEMVRKSINRRNQ